MTLMKTNYKKLFILLFCCLGTVTRGADNYPKSGPNTIRILTYNTSYCRGNYGTSDFTDIKVRALANVIKLLDADVVALQELDSACTERGRRYLLEDIQKATGINYTMIFTPSDLYNNGKVGNGVLVKPQFPVDYTRVIALPDGDYKRIMTRVDLPYFILFATHFDVGDYNSRRLSATILNSELSYTGNKASFLAGDLNDSYQWGGGAFPILIDGGWQITSTKNPTEPGGSSTIDYVLFHDNKKANSGITFSGTNAVTSLISESGSTIKVGEVSDHYPVYLDVEVPGYNSIEKNRANSGCFIYPNPATDYICVKPDLKVDQVRIYAMSGQLVRQDESGRNRIDISVLNPGNYLVEIHSSGVIITQKIIKK